MLLGDALKILGEKGIISKDSLKFHSAENKKGKIKNM